ncbi:MAG: 5-formyltetrahydrofolate cyclo-ligase [Sulfurovum sp.]|uniref:5-formyltetrahydrofolate cyclo-ligase n=1 Tax=Sulfurovum sp. TaxID=1969726 RepID=UPI00286821A9|nr:5-formyltetrahydrofolate cyclo-ligase [Sulfurovum sp.]MCO4844927.1 5-formyltetrahydrofolate cyclo-ligase [Sulfurovum sp.]
MTKESKKKKFRMQSLKRLKKASGVGNYLKDKKIVQALYQTIVESQAKNVMLYVPLKTEVNIYPLIQRLRKEKKVLYVPFMEGASFRLVKYRLPLKKKQFGIKEPNDSKQYRIKNIDIAIVPIVGVDVTQRRVGFGKGMYDRFYEKQNKNIKKTVFVARELCYSKEIITDEYDLRADIIITA